MGRVIRHRLDYGVVFMVDEWYSQKNNFDSISPFV